MDKAQFEIMISRKAEQKYQDTKREFSAIMMDFLKHNPGFDVHEHGTSMRMEIDQLTNGLFEKRKKEIINKLESTMIDKIMSDLKNVRFLFDEDNRG